jgi:hypothetical protein
MTRITKLPWVSPFPCWRDAKYAFPVPLTSPRFGLVASQVPLPPVGGLLNGRYTLGPKMGQGGFGAVYAAEDSATPGTKVAVKVCMERESSLRGITLREVCLCLSVGVPSWPRRQGEL